MSYLPTVYGNRVDVLNPAVDSVCLLDIAAGLSRIPRYLGQFHADHYSVAEHCVLMAREAPPAQAIHFLLHDAAEYVLGDIIHPVKVLFPAIREMEDRLLAVVYEALGLQLPSEAVQAAVHDYDMRMRSTEKLLLVHDEAEWPELAGHPAFDFAFPCWTAAEAEAAFIQCFERMYPLYLRHRRTADGTDPDCRTAEARRKNSKIHFERAARRAGGRL